MVNNNEINKYIIYLRNTKQMTETTIKNYVYDLQIYQSYLIEHRNSDLKNAEENDIYAFLRYLSNEKRYTNTALARKVASINSFYCFLIENNNLRLNPIKDIKITTYKKTKNKYLNMDDIKKLLNGISGNHKCRDQLILLLIIKNGMKLSEVVNIKMTDIFSNYIISNNKTFYLDTETQKGLNEYILIRKKLQLENIKHLFISQKNNKISARTIQQIVSKHLKHAGLGNKGISTNILRHSIEHYQNEVIKRETPNILLNETLTECSGDEDRDYE
jgi:integrase/recombinase XerC